MMRRVVAWCGAVSFGGVRVASFGCRVVWMWRGGRVVSFGSGLVWDGVSLGVSLGFGRDWVECG